MSTTLVNCTPHTVNIRRKDGTILTIESSDNFARVATVKENVSLPGV